MKFFEYQKRYRLEIPRDDMLKVFRRDGRDDNISGDNLERRLKALGDMEDIKYGSDLPYMGATQNGFDLFFTLNVAYDIPNSFRLIEHTIQNYIDGL